MEVIVISKTVQKFNGESFYLCGQYFQHKGKRLHRAVWEYHNGEIPKGYHIHHIDGNRSNNSIENLTLMKSTEHMSQHMQDAERKEKARDNIKKAIEAAPKWHKSENGREWHSKHGKEYWSKKGLETYNCSWCSKEFQTLNVYGKDENHFCSNNCKSAFRRHSGVDNVERTCPICGKTYVVNRYRNNKTCSRECGLERRWGSSRSKA